MKTVSRLPYVAATIALLLIPVAANSQAPSWISFQGVLTDTSGVAVDDPNATIDFDLLNSSGTVWSETHTGVEVVDGGFSVLLGSVTPLTGYEFFESLSLEIEYKGEKFAPRVPLTSAPYAMGLHLPLVAEAPVGGTALLVNNTGPAGDGIRGISNGETGAGLHGRGEAFVGENYGVYGYTASNAGTGVYGLANSIVQGLPTYGVYGKSNSDTGYGVYGEAPTVGVFGKATAGNATDHGVHGETTGSGLGVYGVASGSGTGVYGQNIGTGRAGHFEINNNSNSNYALFAWTQGTGRAGHFEINRLNSGGDALYAKTNGNGSAGFFEKTKASDNDDALVAQTNGSGYALSAVNTGSGPGLYAQADNSVNAGHFQGRLFASHSIETDGFLEARNGNFTYNTVPSNSSVLTVIADGGGQGLRVHNSGSNATGIRVETSAAWGGGGGLAADFQGDVHVGGDLTTSGDINPVIDHPLDRANKFLNHFGLQSSEVLNVYSGNVVTDGSGRAAVDLPDWFEALNSNFRYQLTVVGTFAQAIIEQKIQGNRFVIATSEPGVEVSWQVTGVRQIAGRKPPPVEQDKPIDQRGTFLNPGQGRSAIGLDGL